MGQSSSSLDEGDIVSIVALVVSLIALFGTAAQVLQQYYASAAGYSNCGESVMGEWSKSKRRIFRPSELRFEVQFDAPVVFVCPPDNDRGPVRGAKIHFLDGSNENLRHTRPLPPTEEAKHIQNPRNDVHTADNERASWVTLLSELHSMEKESQTWQEQQYGKNPPQSREWASFKDHSLAVALQSKRKSWDTMPDSVKKPYATTTICHLLEIAAMMGVYWREFDRSNDVYRAEGNGYILTGSNVTDLGLVFNFQICGKHNFKEGRVIPAREVKEMCCGIVSTIFREGNDDRMLDFANEEPKDLSWLHLGSLNEIAETMVLIGCNTNTANYFRSDTARHSHLFPVALELVGMLARNVHIRNTSFRMLPNPTPYHWDKKFFSLRKLVKEFRKQLREDENLEELGTKQLEELLNLAMGVEHELRIYQTDFGIPLLEKLHDAIDECDTFLRNSARRELVTLVLREHFQYVLKMLNNSDPASVTWEQTVRSPAQGPDSPEQGRNDMQEAGHGDGSEKAAVSATRNIDDLYSASPEDRQEKFIDIYFAEVRDRVLQAAIHSFSRRKSTRYAPSTHEDELSAGNEVSGDATILTATSQPPTLAEKQTPMLLGSAESSGSIPKLHVMVQGPEALTLDAQVNDIWCTLVFRMLCWLLLHDFHKKDVQIAKSELSGSRLPVYIL